MVWRPDRGCSSTGQNPAIPVAESSGPKAETATKPSATIIIAPAIILAIHVPPLLLLPAIGLPRHELLH